MEILKFDPAGPEFGNVLSICVAQLSAGKLVAMATETVYGLAGDATSGEAVAAIFDMKQRPQFNPLIAHVNGIEMAQTIGIFDAVSLALAEKFWPGPLTLVVPQRTNSKIHDLVTAELETIAIRCPGGNARLLIEAFGRPLAAPSANLSGRVSPTTASHVRADFDGEDIIVLDGGDCDVGIESTIVQVQSDQITVLRTGSIAADDLTRHCEIEVVLAHNDAAISAPGMMASHYAPRTKVVLDCDEKPPGSAMLAFGNSGVAGDLNLSPDGNLREAAANLYRHMRALDELGKDRICVAPIPHRGLGTAINDRLSRAAAPRPENLGKHND